MPEPLLEFFMAHDFPASDQTSLVGLAALMGVAFTFMVHRGFETPDVESSGYVSRGLFKAEVVMLIASLGVLPGVPFKGIHFWPVGFFLLHALQGLKPLSDNETGARDVSPLVKFWYAVDQLTVLALLFAPAFNQKMYLTVPHSALVAFHSARTLSVSSQLLLCASNVARRDAFAVYTVILVAGQVSTVGDWTYLGLSLGVATGATAAHFGGWLNIPGLSSDKAKAQ